MFIAVFIVAKPVNAGFVSFLENLFGFDNNSQKQNPTNSQTIPLIESALNIDINKAKGGGDITILNNNALLPDSGPLGTIADIEDQKPNSDQISLYVVRKGDNLSQIAEMFNVSVNTIKWTNGITSGNQLQEGQTLIILPISGVQYIIKKGDTLKSIAKKLNADVGEIIQFNELALNSDVIEGQILIVPDGEYSESDSGKTSSSGEKPSTSKKPYYAGYYMRPIEGGRKSQKIHGFNAVDLANSCGTPLMAAASGDVVISRNSGWNAGYGQYIVISHPNGTQTLYGHLSKNIISAGWHVTKGQLIGYVGTTGHSTGCHVHFEIRGARNPF